MERREKTEFILEQMRLLIALAQQKDSEVGGEGKNALGGGEAEWVKARVGGRKVNEEFLKAKENVVCGTGCTGNGVLTCYFDRISN
jgi:26S proteasome regulatory subunit N5